MTSQTLDESFRLFLAENPSIIFLLIWIVVIKAFALWYSAKRNQKIWFMAIIILNTLGILETGYLLYFYFKEKKEKTQNTND